MLQAEKRRQERISVDRQPEGTLCLIRANGARVPIVGVNDISNFGISLYLDEVLEVSTAVRVEYSDAGVCVQVHGNVTWCSIASDANRSKGQMGRFIAGIELVSPMLLISMFQSH